MDRETCGHVKPCSSPHSPIAWYSRFAGTGSRANGLTASRSQTEAAGKHDENFDPHFMG
jgi:hypothetical protein